jgi:hypothetical protein
LAYTISYRRCFRLAISDFKGEEIMRASFSVQADHDDHTLTVTAETAKEAFAKAVEWHVVGRFIDVSISDDNERYSIAEFSSKMALAEIAHTVETAAEPGHLSCIQPHKGLLAGLGLRAKE